MDYYETVMLHYLRADRVIFLNSDYCTQLNEAANPDMSGPHWYCDAVATDFRNKAIFLCEISYSKGLQSLTKRLREWHADWNGLRLALIRDSFLHGDHAQSRPHRLFATTLAVLAQRSADLDKLAEAWQPLYNTLSQEQRQRMAALGVFVLNEMSDAVDRRRAQSEDNED